MEWKRMNMNWNHIKELSPQKIQINLSKVRYISIWNIHRFIGILSIYYIVPSIYHFDIISSGQIDLFSPFRTFPRKNRYFLPKTTDGCGQTKILCKPMGSSRKKTVMGESERSIGVKVDGPNDSKWAVESFIRPRGKLNGT